LNNIAIAEMIAPEPIGNLILTPSNRSAPAVRYTEDFGIWYP